MYVPKKNKTAVKILEYKVLAKTPEKFCVLKLAKENKRK
jgi:hypothetical protein